MVNCTKCFSVLARGYPHSCTKTQFVRNIAGLASDYGTPTAKEKVASTLFQDKIQSSVSENIDNSVRISRSNTRPLILKHTDPSTSHCKKLFSAQDISAMQKDLDLSNSQTLRLATHLRTATQSRKIIQSNLDTELRGINHSLDDLYTVATEKFLLSGEITDSTNVNFVERPFVFCNRIEELIKRIHLFRSKSYGHVKIGLDGGGDMFKVTLSLHNIGELQVSSKRHTYKDGIAPKHREDGSVKKLFIIALVPNIPENYRNLLFIWTKLDLIKIVKNLGMSVSIAADLKIVNILLGLMSHSSMHPCSWCESSKSELNEHGKLRSLGLIRDKFWRWTESSTGKKGAKDFGNVTHLPLFNCLSDETLVLDIIPPPELHLLIGPFTTIYNALISFWPEADHWLKVCNVERTACFGGTFNGNACKNC